MMSDEQPVLLKKKKIAAGEQSGRFCIVHYTRSPSASYVRPLSDTGFQKIRLALDIRQGQQNVAYRLDEICHNVPILYDSEHHGTHEWCYKNFMNTSKVIAAIKKTDVSTNVVSVNCDSAASSLRSCKPAEASAVVGTALYPVILHLISCHHTRHLVTLHCIRCSSFAYKTVLVDWTCIFASWSTVSMLL